ncbi:MAG TPA: hypothetical protein VNA69_14670 [Thermoanaerobaculia bacterium]|nr:hypothetical protein [Thermoanaerobaculia bacterium]
MRVVDDPERHKLERKWLNGGSALPLVALLASRGMDVEASAVARVALARPDCEDAGELEEMLDRLSQPPDDWRDLLDSFAEAPSLERWRELMQFVPPELIYMRQRAAVRYLSKRGMDGDLLFLCACEYGLTPDAIELVEEGHVAVQTLITRAERAAGARATYIGLAAEAAFLTGDLVGTIRLLRESMASETEWCLALPHIVFVREHATPADHEALDKAGIPPWPDT